MESIRWGSLGSVRFQRCPPPAGAMKHCDPCKGAVYKECTAYLQRLVFPRGVAQICCPRLFACKPSEFVPQTGVSCIGFSGFRGDEGVAAAVGLESQAFCRFFRLAANTFREKRLIFLAGPHIS